MKVGNGLNIYVDPEDWTSAALVERDKLPPSGMMLLDFAVEQKPDNSLPHMILLQFDNVRESRVYEQAIEDAGLDNLLTMINEDTDGTGYVLLINTDENLPLEEKPDVLDRRSPGTQPDAPSPR